MKPSEDIARDVVHSWYDDPDNPHNHEAVAREIADIAAAIEADRAAHHTRVMQLCRAWARYWNWLYEESSRRRRGRVMYHLIGTAVSAVGQKIIENEEPPKSAS